MMQMLRNLGIALGLWLARLCGWNPVQPCRRPHLPDDALITVAMGVITEVERAKAGEPGPVKAREALRMLLNILPERSTRDLNLLIELALQRGA